jgi:hypothetical protein
MSVDRISTTKSKYSTPCTGQGRPWGFHEFVDPRFLVKRHMKVARLSAVCTGRLYPQEVFLVTHLSCRLSRPQDHSTAGIFRPMRNFSDTIGNRTRGLTACSAVPQPTAQPRWLHEKIPTVFDASNKKNYHKITLNIFRCSVGVKITLFDIWPSVYRQINKYTANNVVFVV